MSRFVDHPEKAGQKIEKVSLEYARLASSGKYNISSDGSFKLKFKNKQKKRLDLKRKRKKIPLNITKKKQKISLNITFKNKKKTLRVYHDNDGFLDFSDLKVFHVDYNVFLDFKGRVTKGENANTTFFSNVDPDEDDDAFKDEFLDFLRSLDVYPTETIDDVEINSIEELQVVTTGGELMTKRGVSAGYSFISQIDTMSNNQLGKCVVEYIHYVVNNEGGRNSFRNKWSLDMTEAKFKKIGIDPHQPICYRQFIMFVDEHLPRCNVVALDPLYRLVGDPRRVIDADYSFCFLINNGHLYPLYNDNIFKLQALRSGKINANSEIDLVKIKSFLLSDESTFVPEAEYQKIIDGYMTDIKMIVTDKDICELGVELISKTGLMPNNINFTNSQMTSFIHPVTEQIIVFSKNYNQRKKLCDHLFKRYQIEDFKFKNQSYTQIVNAVFKCMSGRFGGVMKANKKDPQYKPIKGKYTKRDQELTDRYFTRPLTQRTEAKIDPEAKLTGYDIVSDYPSCLTDMPSIGCYYTFTALDTWEPYLGEAIAPGEYILKHEVVPKSLDGFRIPVMILPYILVKDLLKRGFIEMDDIACVRKASFTVPAEPFALLRKKLTSIVRKLYPDDDEVFKKVLKGLLVSFIGSLGKRYSQSIRAFVTTSRTQMCSAYWDHVHNNPRSKFSKQECNGMYFVSITERKRLKEDTSSFMRQIYGLGIMKLMTLISKVLDSSNPKSRLIGYKTDSVFVLNGRDPPGLGSIYRREYWSPPKYKAPPQVEAPLLTQQKDWILLEKTHGESMCMIGPPGSGKSFEARTYFDLRTLALAFTNKACSALRCDGFETVYTFDSFFTNRPTISRANFDRLIVDEFSMVPWFWIEILMEFKEKGGIVQMYGDPNQCAQVAFRHFDYLKRRAFQFLCDNNLYVAEYNVETGRYTEDLHLFVRELESTLVNPTYHHNEIDMSLRVNICKTLKKCQEINDYFSGGVFRVGHPVICNKNFKKQQIFNSIIYRIENVHEKSVKINGFWVDKKHVEHGFAVTVYRYQGDTIPEPYNIHEVEKMDFNEFYTAVSRGKRLSDVHFPVSTCGRKFVRISESPYPSLLVQQLPKSGEIYLMENHESKVCYVGKTTRDTLTRFQEHKDDSEDTIHKYDGKWVTKCVAKIAYFSSDVLDNYEQAYTLFYRKHHPKKYECVSQMFKIDNRVKCLVVTEPSVKGVNIDTKHKFDFTDNGKEFRIRAQVNGVKIEKRKRYSEKNKEIKKSEIEKIRMKLIETYA